MLGREYLAWNEAIAETIYNVGMAGQPVYLDLDDTAFERITLHPALNDFDKSKAALCAAVKAELHIHGAMREVVWPIALETRTWMRNFLRGERPKNQPPMIAFLAVAVLAAEEMGNGDENPNAYYAHFDRLLGVAHDSPEGKKLDASYKEYILYFWGSLRKWLTELEWQYGMPTAEALSHPYISLSISQALIREGDRKKLGSFFNFIGLNPGESVAPSEMAEFFGLWQQREDSHISNSLKTLWGKASARDRISEVLSRELESWDGSMANYGASGSGAIGARIPQTRKLKLTLKISSWLGQQTLKHGLSISQSGNITDQPTIWHAAVNPEQDLKFKQDSKTSAILESSAFIELADLLVGDLELVSGASLKVRRLPKDIVVLSHDEELQAYVEVDRASLLQDLMILAKTKNEVLVPLQGLLSKNARPGFNSVNEKVKGLPEGWTLILNVQLVSSGDQYSGNPLFSALTSSMGSQLVLAGGVRIPGPMSSKKYLSSRAPELRASSQDHRNVKVVLSRYEWDNDQMTEVELETFPSQNGVVIADLADYLDEDGDYQVVLHEAGKPTIQRMFYLRSGEKPDPLGLRSAKTLGHSFVDQGAMAVFEASEIDLDASQYVIGAFANYSFAHDFEEQGFAKALLSWESSLDENKDVSAKDKIHIPVVQDTSCIRTGAHNWELPLCVDNATYVIGVCKKCNQTKPQLCDAWKAKKKQTYQKLEKARQSVIIQRVEEKLNEEIDLEEVFSLLQHAIGGTCNSIIKSLEALAPESISGYQILELMEQLGHVEVSRTSGGTPDLWSLVPKQVVKVSETNTAILIGSWLKEDLDNISLIAGSVGFSEKPRFGFEILLTSAANDLNEWLEEHGILLGAAHDLANALPELGWVRLGLQTSALPALETVSTFNLKTGKWDEVEVALPGALRVTGAFGSKYFYCTSDDLAQSQGFSTSATIAKYLIANERGVSLLKYSPAESALYVPLGAKIPGLYGRAILTASATPPVDVAVRAGDKRLAATRYSNVPQEIASFVAKLLVS